MNEYKSILYIEYLVIRNEYLGGTAHEKLRSGVFHPKSC